MTLWRDLRADPITETSDHMLMWREDWIDPDFCRTGVLMGCFQEGPPGEMHYKVAAFLPDQDCYCDRELYDPAEWPTHCADIPNGPSA